MNYIDVEKITISDKQQGRRLDNFLLTRIKGVPKSRIYSIIRRGEVRINSKRSKPSSRINAGDIIRIPPLRRPAERSDEPNAELITKIKDSIIFQNDDLIVINKPRWVGSHGGINQRHGVIETLQHIMQDKEIYLVHRLDLETTGVLIIALNLDTLRGINQVWHEKDCHKIYLMRTYGSWEAKEKKVVTHLAKSYKSGEYLMQSLPEVSKDKKEEENQYKNNPVGKEAITLFKLVKKGKDSSLVEAELQTGRTHQIRLQCAELGHPIVGDSKYSFMAGIKEQSKELALHCWKIEIKIAGKQYKFEAPLPSVFQNNPT